MTTSQWVNTVPDAGALPALLLRLAESIPARTIDELWIFPTRRIAIGESTVITAAAFDPDDEQRRRVITARFAVTRDRKGIASVHEKLDEHGTAPASAVARIIQGVLRRLGEEGEQPPRACPIQGDDERWWGLIEELGGSRPPATPALAPSESVAAQPAAAVAGEPRASAGPGQGATDGAGNRPADPATATEASEPDNGSGTRG